MKSALKRAGYKDVRQQWNAMVSFEILRISRALRHGRSPASAGGDKRFIAPEIIVEAIEAAMPRYREFLTFVAQKPPAP